MLLYKKLLLMTFSTTLVLPRVYVICIIYNYRVKVYSLAENLELILLISVIYIQHIHLKYNVACHLKAGISESEWVSIVRQQLR
jgi:hypothetical protein